MLYAIISVLKSYTFFKLKPNLLVGFVDNFIFPCLIARMIYIKFIIHEQNAAGRQINF